MTDTAKKYNRVIRVKITEEWKEDRPGDSYPRSCDRTVLVQDVDTLDLKAVIAAINGLAIP